MNRWTLIAVWAMFGLFIDAPTANAGDICAVHHAVRDGDAVKVVFAKGFPPAAITHSNGSKIFVNTGVYKPSTGYTVQNPHPFVVLRDGDELGIIGMDSGCTVTVVHVGRKLELKMSIGNRVANLMPVQDDK